MKVLTKFLKEKSINFLFIPFLVFGFIFHFVYGKGQSHLIINEFHNDVADFFFKNVTHLGDGIIFPVLIIASLFIKFRWSLYFIASALLTLIAIYLAKHVLITEIPRPVAFYGDSYNLHLVDGIKMYLKNSFPSGHTATAFAVSTILILIVKNNYLKFVFALYAIIAGFSRIYLSQHFLIDVLAGAILGIFIGLISCHIIDEICSKNKITLDERISLKFSKKKNDLKT